MRLTEYINESKSYSSTLEIQTAINQYMAAGEIINPEYQELTYQVKKLLRNESEMVRSQIRNNDVFYEMIKHSDLLPGLYDGLLDIPTDSFVSYKKWYRGITKLEKSLEEYDMPDEWRSMIEINIVKAKDLFNRWNPIGESLKDLKKIVVKVTVKRAEARVEKEKEMQRKFTDSYTLIKLFEKDMNGYLREAEKQTKNYIAQLIKNLEKNDWDINKIIPDRYDRTGMRQIYRSITEPKDRYNNDRNSEVVKKSQKGIDRFIKMNLDTAAANYRNFMQKMIEKIGEPVVDASMKGNIWTNTILSVTTYSGEKQTWHTKAIINFSKYGKMFNQFPSRRQS